jgi:hypothetical protein
MRRKIIILWFFTLTVTAFSQRQTQYNINGDEAMKRFDYSEAMIWYGEGIVDCNRYSINQLTKIWLIDESLRPSMNYVMSKCLTCLSDRATEIKDTASINQLILYYTEGIGTLADENTVNFWRELLETITNVNERQLLQKEKGKNRVNVFIGYSANMLAPAGLTLGIAGKRIGGYVRYRTNLSFKDYTAVCDAEEVKGMDGYRWSENKKANSMIISGGLIFKPTQKFLISTGGGYWKRDLLYEFEKIDLNVTQLEGTFWAKNEEDSFSGLALDLDGTYRMGKRFYVSAGCSLMNYKYANGNMRIKYAYGNVGIGVFF